MPQSPDSEVQAQGMRGTARAYMDHDGCGRRREGLWHSLPHMF